MKIRMAATTVFTVILAGCNNGSNPTMPSSLDPQQRQSIESGTLPNAVSSDGWTISGPTGCISPDDNLFWTLNVKDAGDGLHLVKAAFHDPKAGCDATLRNPTNLNSNGPMDYDPHQEGNTSFWFEPSRITCGRVQVDVSIIYPDGKDQLIVGLIINSGKDCEDSIVPPSDPQSPPLPSCSDCEPPQEDDPPSTHEKCNQGVGNGPEGCDPGNSNQGDPENTNDDEGGTPGNPGKRN